MPSARRSSATSPRSSAAGTCSSSSTACPTSSSAPTTWRSSTCSGPTGRRVTRADEDVANVKDALRDPANLAAALGYYRATLGDGFVDPALADVQAAGQTDPTQPTLYLHGADDGCIGVEVAEWAADHAPDNISVRVFEGCGHFLHLEHPQAINDDIVEFLS